MAEPSPRLRAVRALHAVGAVIFSRTRTLLPSSRTEADRRANSRDSDGGDLIAAANAAIHRASPKPLPNSRKREPDRYRVIDATGSEDR